jgi:hypothetical protein
MWLTTSFERLEEVKEKYMAISCRRTAGKYPEIAKCIHHMTQRSYWKDRNSGTYALDSSMYHAVYIPDHAKQSKHIVAKLRRSLPTRLGIQVYRACVRRDPERQGDNDSSMRTGKAIQPTSIFGVSLHIHLYVNAEVPFNHFE